MIERVPEWNVSNLLEVLLCQLNFELNHYLIDHLSLSSGLDAESEAGEQPSLRSLQPAGVCINKNHDKLSH